MVSIRQIVNVDLVKQLNSAAVYKLIDQQGPISRIQIAEYSQLAPASVTKIMRNLLSRGLVREVEQQQSTGGRRATSIIAEQQNFFSLLVNIGKTELNLGLMDFGANLLEDHHIKLPKIVDKNTLEAMLIEQIGLMLQKAEQFAGEIVAIAITLPAIIDAKSECIQQLPHFSLEKPWFLAEIISKQFNLPTYLGHDVRSLALAEHYFGATQDCDDSLLLRIHSGVGAGIVINHEIFSGHKNSVGEIGHIQVDPAGHRCLCGNVGCLETVVSNQAIEEKMHQMLIDGYYSKWLSLDRYNIESICQATLQDQAAKTLIEDVGTQIGRVLAMSVNMFNPQKIVISGEITQAKEVLFPAIRAALEKHAVPALVADTKLMVSKLQNEKLIGAFALIKKALFDGHLLQLLLKEM